MRIGITCYPTYGGSGIVAPKGQYIAGPVWDKEALVYGEINLGDCDRGRIGINLTGIYDRTDILNLGLREDNYEPLAPIQATRDNIRLERIARRLNRLESGMRSLRSQ